MNPNTVDIFALLGQSNMDGTGSLDEFDNYTNERILRVTRQNTLAVASEPLNEIKVRVTRGHTICDLKVTKCLSPHDSRNMSSWSHDCQNVLEYGTDPFLCEAKPDQVTPKDKSFSPSALQNIAQILGTTNPQVTGQVTGQVAGQVAALISRLHDGEWSRKDLMEKLQLRGRDNFENLYLLPALNAGLIERTIPDKPTSRLQKYRLTQKGRKILSELKSE